MPPIVFLLLALLCGVISRCLLIKNAFGVSVWWGFGVFLPFGPAFFRIKYPDEVHRPGCSVWPACPWFLPM